MKSIFKLKFLISLTGIILFPSWFCYSQINISLSNEPFTILANNGSATMAGSILSGIYDGSYGLNLQSNSLNNGVFSEPEFLILADFISKKNRDKESMLALYDEESRNAADKKVNISEAYDAYQIFSDFKLISKFVYGDNVRIRYNLIGTDGKTYPWVQRIKKVGSRYYLTEITSQDNLLTQIGSISPYNKFGTSFTPVNTAGMTSLKYVSTGATSMLNQGISSNDYAGIYLSIERIDGNYSGGEAVLLNKMIAALKSGSSSDFINLWKPEVQQSIYETDNFDLSFQAQSDFYKTVSDCSPAGILRAGNELVLFYFCTLQDKNRVMQLVPMEISNGSFYLLPQINSYYGWTLLNTPLIKNEIQKILQ